MSRSSSSSAAQTAIRLIHTLNLIPRRSGDHHRKIGTSELLTRLTEAGFQLNRRTLQRDLKNLADHFPALKNDGNRDALGWYWENEAELIEIPAMDPAMAMSFKIAEKFLQPVMPAQLKSLHPYFKAASHVLDASTGKWLDRIHVEPRAMPLIPARIDPRVIDGVHQALSEDRRIRARYRRRDGETAEYELNPLGLVLRHEVTYLVATAWEFEDPRHYALHRFDGDHFELLDTPSRQPEGFDFDRYIREANFQYPLSDRTLNLQLRIRRDTALHLAETPLSEDQIIEDLEPEDPEWQRIRASVPDSLQLRWWLRSLGGQVIVEEPDDLMSEMKEDLRKMKKLYSE